LAMFSHGDSPQESVKQLFKENEWNLVDVGQRLDCRTTSDQCSPGIHMNVLTIAPGVIVCEENETTMIKILREEGCDVIPIPFSAAYPWGGSLNCFTLDIYRHGPVAKSYFPTLDIKEERDAAKREEQAVSQRKRVAEGFTPRVAKNKRPNKGANCV